MTENVNKLVLKERADVGISQYIAPDGTFDYTFEIHTDKKIDHDTLRSYMPVDDLDPVTWYTSETLNGDYTANREALVGLCKACDLVIDNINLLITDDTLEVCNQIRSRWLTQFLEELAEDKLSEMPYVGYTANLKDRADHNWLTLLVALMEAEIVSKEVGKEIRQIQAALI